MASPRNEWTTRFPVYQIDFAAVAAGKRVASTKRRIRWRFGFPNKEALAAGQTGTECRGEEHDVTVVWSITSGKRQVSMDGREIHYSSSRSGVLDFSWTTRGNHVMKVIAHAAPPMSAVPGFRQYDLLIDGQSFFTMPKVFELGIRGPSSQSRRVPGGYAGGPTSPSMGGYGGPSQAPTGAPRTRSEEEEALQMAIQASLAESRQHFAEKSDQMTTYTAPPPSNSGNADLLGFDAAPAPIPSDAQSTHSFNSGYSAPTTYNNAPPPPVQTGAYHSPPAIQQGASQSPSYGGALVPAQAPAAYPGAPPPQVSPASYGAPPPQVSPANYGAPPPRASPANGYGAPPPPVNTGAPAAYPNYLAPAPSADVFGLQSAPGEDPFAPKPPPPKTHSDIASAILGAYSAPTTPAGGVPANNFASPDSFTSQGQPLQPSPPKQPNQQNGHSNGAVMTMGSLEKHPEEKPKSEFERAMLNLVNIDHIDEPAVGEVKLTVMKKEEEKKGPKGKSRGLPPAAKDILGKGATLSQIKDVKPERGQKDPNSIMKAPPPGLFQAGAAGAGALVVHGEGPPPLQQPTGFGIGAYLPNGGLNNPQKPSMMTMQGYAQPQQQGY